MPRNTIHASEEILDATRGLLLDEGAAAATVNGIAQRSGAPVGSLYHRFGSRDELIAQLWIRAVRRSQAPFLAAVTGAQPHEAIVRGALSIYDFVAQHPDDARLLLAFRRKDLLREASSPQLVAELGKLNHAVDAAVRKLAGDHFGKADREALEQIWFAVFDIPHAAVRRHLLAGKPFPRALRGNIEAAVRAVLHL